MLDERKSAILQSVVELHIRSGEPVSSRAVLDHSGLAVSSATVRNDLAALERDGYVAQPHISSGRVPSDLGYRYYVDHLSTYRLRSAIHAKIEGFFVSMHDELDRLLQRTSEMVSDITHLPALVMGPGLSVEPMHAIHMVPLGGRMALAVLVSDTGRVTKQAFRLPPGSRVEDLEEAETLLADVCHGLDLRAAAAALEGLPRAEWAPSVKAVAQHAISAVQSSSPGAEVFLGGTSRLATLWVDLAKVQTILDLLEHQAAIQEILADVDEDTMVRIGSELPLPDADATLIAARYEAGGGAEGRVAVIGPKRLDYRRTIRVVEEVSENLGETLGA